jgi:succinyl-CoA synthetase beta subunit
MKIHEYQARQLLADAGLPVPNATVIASAQQAANAFWELDSDLVVVKAQVHAGGRGKAGYVKLVRTPEEAAEHAKRMFAEPMVSAQTGPEGVKVRRILLAAGVDIAKEFYVGAVIDRRRSTAVMMASREGGVEIEEVAKRNPDAILKQWMHPTLGLVSYQARELVQGLGLTGRPARQAEGVIMTLARLFQEYDCSLAEINPLVLTKRGRIAAIDAKFNFDDNALFRQPKIRAMFDPSEENPNELRAKEYNLSYIALDGNIGCLVNGAGLAMSTMDIIKLHGGEPANFLDVGGSVTTEGAIEAFRIILADPKVKGVLVNIFGGIAKCDVIADALITAGKEVGFKVPVVVRLEGTNVDKARKMLAEARADLPTLITATDLTDAAKKVCAQVA